MRLVSHKSHFIRAGFLRAKLQSFPVDYNSRTPRGCEIHVRNVIIDLNILIQKPVSGDQTNQSINDSNIHRAPDKGEILLVNFSSKCMCSSWNVFSGVLVAAPISHKYISSIEFETYRVRFKNKRWTIMKSPRGFRQYYRSSVTCNIVIVIILTMYSAADETGACAMNGEMNGWGKKTETKWKRKKSFKVTFSSSKRAVVKCFECNW